MRQELIAVMLKFVRQALRLSFLWVAICTSLAGMLVYTKSGLEVLFADVIAEQAQARTAAGQQQPRVRPQ